MWLSASLAVCSHYSSAAENAEAELQTADKTTNYTKGKTNGYRVWRLGGI